MKSFTTSLISLLLLVACSKSESLRSGDLIFVCSNQSEASQAISSATWRNAESRDFSHVGIIEVAEDGVFVIDATPRHGVCRRPLDEFFDEERCGRSGDRGVEIMRLIGENSIENFIDRAKTYVGQEYDHYFLPDNGRMYCSELVYESFVTDAGDHIFSANPMNFRAVDGSMPDYWVKLFDSLQSSIPQGTMGTNPNALAKERRLRRVNIDLNGR